MQYILKTGIIGIVLFITISSVAGMSAIFKSIALPIGALMFFIECAKYGAVGYGYKEWQHLTTRFKVLLVAFVTLLSLLTSIGIFGFLGASFQQAHSASQKTAVDTISLTAEKGRLEARIDAIDVQVSELPKDFVNGRLKLLQAFADERREAANRLKTVNDKLSASQTAQIDAESDLGPVSYISKFTNTSVEDVVGYIIIILAGTLDALALYLTTLVNRPKHIEPRKVGRPRKTVEKVVKKVKPKVEKKIEPVLQDWNFK